MRCPRRLVLQAVLAAVALGASPAAPAQAAERFVDPARTDPALASEGGLARHVVWDAQGTPRGRLVLFLGGTGSKPGFYETFGAHAAALGDDVIDLRYPNDRLVASQCRPAGRTTAQLDACFAQVRGTTLFGRGSTTGAPPDPVAGWQGDVTRTDAVEHRLVALLRFLGWTRYLTSDGQAPRWASILAAGHSQGAGHALFLARRLPLAGAALLSGPDDTVAGRPASWIGPGPSATPPPRIAALRHASEQAFCAGCAAAWTAAGLTRTTVTTLRPGSCPPLVCAALQFHDSTAVDSAVAVDGAGAPLLGPVWDAMLTPPPTTTTAAVATPKRTSTHRPARQPRRPAKRQRP